MSKWWWHTSAGLSAAGNVAKALATLLGAGLVASLVGESMLATALIAIGAVAAAAAVLFAWAEGKAKAREQSTEEDRQQAAAERQRLALLATTVPGVRDLVPRVRELSAYELGTDREEIPLPRGGVGRSEGYVERDRDGDLRQALVVAWGTGTPRMLVLRGPSKAGKTRTLFEAVAGEEELREAALLAPRDGEALARLLEPDGLPQLPSERVLLWLDDIERFVMAGGRGMNAAVLDALAAWPRTVVLATAGDKGAEEPAAERLSLPIQDLYRDPRVLTVPLESELTDSEKARVRARFPPKVAEEMVEHGIGEYLVAAPELARKLEEERHKPGDPVCPEGAAAVWAAIDWSRAGMIRPVPRETLKQLWKHYLRGLDPADPRIEDRFQDGLDWGLRPPYRSIALLSYSAGYQAYDWIVARVDHRLHRDINPVAWDFIFEMADSEVAFDLGVAALKRGNRQRSANGFRSAQHSTDPDVSARATSNLGVLLAEQGDAAGAAEAYQRAIDSGHPDAAPAAAFGLGVLHAQRGDRAGAAEAFQRAIDSGHRDWAPWAAFDLGVVRVEQGDRAGAAEAFQRAIDSGHPNHAPRAAFNLGVLWWDNDPAGAEEAFQRAIDSGHRDWAPKAAFNLGSLRAEHGDRVGAEEAFKLAAASGHPDHAARALIKLSLLARGRP
jgi:TolA-binding protein